MQEIYRRTPMSNTQFDMGVHLRICYIFTEHLVLRTPLDGCFWSLQASTMAQFIGIFRKKNSKRPGRLTSQYAHDLNWTYIRRSEDVLTFRRCPGHLLNVLCTLHLCPVSTGKVLNAPSDLFSKIRNQINPFSANVPLLYPLKTSENCILIFSGGIEVEHWLKMG